jgi:CPA1 family monovalent cation:H+ antiporter
MAHIEIALALLLAVSVIAALAKWVPLPLPILLIAGGIALSFAPGFGAVKIDPEIFFLLFIPPLLYADGWLMPKRDLREVITAVLLLAFGLVFLTVIAVGYMIHWLVPELPLAAAFALGAIVSPTDAVAVSAVTSKLKLPSRVTTIVNGESLINDASGLVAFKFAVAAAATGAFSLQEATAQFFVLSLGGFGLGLAVAWVIGEIRVRMTRHGVSDPSIQTALSVLSPFAAYLVAENLHTSGILAVVAAGLYGGIHDGKHLDLATRAHAWEVWHMLLYVFNGLVFLLLGLQLPSVFASLARASWLELAGVSLALFALLVVLRALWVLPSCLLPGAYSIEREARDPSPALKHVFLVAWSGIRGSVTMAAALSIPLVTAAGTPFPGRDLIVFLAASTIVLSLIVNGLTLPLFIRVLNIRGDGNAEREERAARIAMAQAAADALRQELARLTRADEVRVANALIARCEQRAERYAANAERRHRLDELDASERRLCLVALHAERAELDTMRDDGVVNDETLRLLQSDLDHAEATLTGAHARSGH